MSAFIPYDGASLSLSAIAASAIAVNMGSLGDTIMIHNRGPDDARIRQGAASVQAILSDLLIPLQSSAILRKGGTHISAICETGQSAVLEICPGNGESPVSGTPKLEFEGEAVEVYLRSLLYGEDSTNNLIATARKHPVVSTYSPSSSTSFGTAITANAKATPAIFKGARVTNINAAIRYFQIFNTTGATTPVLHSFPIPAGSGTVPGLLELGEDILGSNGIYLSTGITWGISTTHASYVAATASDHNVNLFYY